MKKRLLLISSVLLLITGCDFMNINSSNGNSVSNSNTDNPTTVTPGTSIYNPTTSIEPTGEDFMPKVGEVRKWFDHGILGESYYYNYCPSVFIEDNVKHIYYCTNQEEGNVTDYVGYRTGTYSDHWEYSDLDFVLEPTPDTWDARHVCDPAVIKGEFKYRGEDYTYLMAFLGCITSDCTKNETGLAVAKSPAGPWIKCNDINPIVPYDRQIAAWGTGQPDLVSVDQKGRVILFTTEGNTTGTITKAYEYDLSNIDNPILIREKKVPTYGLLSHESNANVIANATFSYDVENKKILMAKGRLPFGLDGRYPNMIADTIDVYYLDDSENEGMFDEIFKGNNAYDWKHLGAITPELTGFPKNHNNGIVRDEYGYTISNELVEVAFTRSDYGSNWNHLSTYRIYSTSFKLDYTK